MQEVFRPSNLTGYPVKFCMKYFTLIESLGSSIVIICEGFCIQNDSPRRAATNACVEAYLAIPTKYVTNIKTRPIVVAIQNARGIFGDITFDFCFGLRLERALRNYATFIF